MATISYRIGGSFDGSAADKARAGLAKLGESASHLGTAFKAFIGLQVFKVMANGIGESVKAFSDGQAASAKMLQSISTNASLTSGAYQRLTTFADKLKMSTAIDDDVINGQIQYLNGLGMTEDRMKSVITAATDLSAAGVMPLDAAVKALAKTTEGVGGSLAKQIPAIGNLTAEQLRAGDAIAMVQKSFGGMAETAANTLQGKTAKMAMVVDDIKKSFGAAFGAVEAVAFDAIGPVLEKISTWLKDKLPEIVSFMQNLPKIASVAFGAVGQIIKKVFTWDFMATAYVAAMNAVIQIAVSGFKILVAMVNAIGTTIWTPLKYGFDLVVYGINVVFTGLVNFFIKGFQDMINFLLSGLNSVLAIANKVSNFVGAGDIVAEVKPVEFELISDPTKPIFDKAAIDDSWANLGKTFLTEAGKIASTVGGAASTIGEQFAPIVNEAGAQIAAIVEAGKPAAQAFIDGSAAVAQAVSALTDEEQSLLDYYSSQDYVDAIAGSGYETSASYMPTVDPTMLSGITDALKGAFSGGDVFGSLTSSLAPLVTAIQPLLNMFMSANPLLAILLPIIQGFISVIGPAVTAVIKPLMDALGKVGQMLGAALLPILQALTPVFNILAQIIITLVTPLIQMLSPAIELVVVLFTILEPILKGVAVVFTVLMAPIQFLADLFTYVGEVIGTFAYNVGQVISNILTPWNIRFRQGPGAFQSDAFSGLADRIADIWNASATTDLSGYASPDGSTAPGSSASYSGPSVVNITVNVDYTNSWVTDFRDLSLMINDEIKSAVKLGLA